MKEIIYSNNRYCISCSDSIIDIANDMNIIIISGVININSQLLNRGDLYYVSCENNMIDSITDDYLFLILKNSENNNDINNLNNYPYLSLVDSDIFYDTNHHVYVDLDDKKKLMIYLPYMNEDRKIIYNMKHLELIMNELKGKENILTSGCFDIVHVGHLELLKKAKLEGENLIVCLTNDIEIRQLKGENRPINCYIDRINLFKTIPYVDYIILFKEDDIIKETTLDKIMNIINPKYWVKGDDYKVEDIQKKHPNVCVKLFKNVPDISTTKIILNIIDKMSGKI